MLSDLVNGDGYIYLEAHPEYYDSMESLAINTKTREFEICEGGGQRVNTVYRGTADYLQSGILILHYKEEEISKTTMDSTITFKYNITNNTTKHFNGYSLIVSNHSVTFDRSLLTAPDQSESHPQDPLLFYTADGNEECDVELYRAKMRIERDKDVEIPAEFAEYYNTDLSDDILSKIVTLRRAGLRDTVLDFTTILGASNEGLLLYYTDKECFLFLSPSYMKVYLEDYTRNIPLDPKIVHTFDFTIKEDQEMIQEIVNVMDDSTRSDTVKEFTKQVTNLF